RSAAAPAGRSRGARGLSLASHRAADGAGARAGLAAGCLARAFAAAAPAPAHRLDRAGRVGAIAAGTARDRGRTRAARAPEREPVRAALPRGTGDGPAAMAAAAAAGAGAAAARHGLAGARGGAAHGVPIAVGVDGGFAPAR